MWKPMDKKIDRSDNLKDKFYKLILAVLDTFLILFFMFFTAYIFMKYGITDLNVVETCVYSLCITIMPVICKYIVLKIEKETDIKEKVTDHLLHILSGYIVFLFVVSITKHTQSQMFVLVTSTMALLIMYLLFGEYSFSLSIDTTSIRREKYKITKQFIENEEIHELLIDKTYDEATVLVTIDVFRNEKDKLDINFKDIKIEKKEEMIEENESDIEGDK